MKKTKENKWTHSILLLLLSVIPFIGIRAQSESVKGERAISAK